MATINEIQIGVVPELNGMTMFRKYDGERGFSPYFRFKNDDELTLDSNIVVNYIEYFKNSEGVIIKELTKYKNYVVGNRAATYKTVVDQEATYYTEGEVITPATMDGEIEISPAVIATGIEVKIPETYKEVVDVPEWLGANRWFLSVARTPMYAPYGIMDGIEATLAGLPKDTPSGYVLTSPL